MDLLLVSIASMPAEHPSAGRSSVRNGPPPSPGGDLSAALKDAGASTVEEFVGDTWTATVDAAALRLPGPRLVIDADLAHLNLALKRLLRSRVLDSAETAVLLRQPVPYLTRIGLPGARTAQLEVAVTGLPRKIGVIKDDSGGLCLDSAAVSPWESGQQWWCRAVVDDERFCDGTARSIRVRRIGPAELEATVRFGRWRRRTCRGRSLQLACDQAQIITDGVGRERPRGKRTFWSEPTLWNLVLPRLAHRSGFRGASQVGCSG